VRDAPETEPRPRNLEAYEYYIKGMSVNKSRYVVSFREEDFASAVAMLDRSIEIDSDYAPSYLGLAWAYEHHYQVTDDTLDAVRMQQAAQKALALDPLSGAANAVMAYAAFEYGHDVDGAFRLLERALELNPNDALVNLIAGA
jgi:Tfp pilus assembly protein PilF